MRSLHLHMILNQISHIDVLPLEIFGELITVRSTVGTWCSQKENTTHYISKKAENALE